MLQAPKERYKNEEVGKEALCKGGVISRCLFSRTYSPDAKMLLIVIAYRFC